jgi:hypothetical protein
MTPAPEDTPAYTVEEAAGGRFQVQDAEGGVILVCGDRSSAEHYASLLNRAFRQGYKQGLRRARQR